MIHTVELSKMISKDMFEQTKSLLKMRYYRRCFVTTKYAEQGFPCIRLYKKKNPKYKGTEDNKNSEDNDLMYLYMIVVTVNTGSMFGGDSHLSNNIISFTPDFVKAIYSNIYDRIPCIENGKKYERFSSIWLELNIFKNRRLDVAFDIKTMHPLYATLLNRGYRINRGSYERKYYDNDKTDNDISIPDYEEFLEDYEPDVNYVYYYGNSANINAYIKNKEMEKKQEQFADGTDYEFLRLEVQAKKPKLHGLIHKLGLKGRELQYLASPKVEEEILTYYVNALTGSGMYVTYDTAMRIIDTSKFLKHKKQKLKDVITAIRDEQGIANVLDKVKDGTITTLGKLTTVKAYLRDIHKLGINPVTIPADMENEVPVRTLKDLTGGSDIQERVLPNLVDIIKAYCQQIQEEQLQGTPITDEVLKQIDKI